MLWPAHLDARAHSTGSKARRAHDARLLTKETFVQKLDQRDLLIIQRVLPDLDSALGGSATVLYVVQADTYGIRDHMAQVVAANSRGERVAIATIDADGTAICEATPAEVPVHIPSALADRAEVIAAVAEYLQSAPYSSLKLVSIDPIQGIFACPHGFGQGCGHYHLEFRVTVTLSNGNKVNLAVHADTNHTAVMAAPPLLVKASEPDQWVFAPRYDTAACY